MTEWLRKLADKAHQTLLSIGGVLFIWYLLIKLGVL